MLGVANGRLRAEICGDCGDVVNKAFDFLSALTKRRR